MATAFANLRDGTTIEPLDRLQSISLLLFVIMLCSFASWRWNPVRVMPGALLLLCVYGGIALWLFAIRNAWLPLIAPMIAVVMTMLGGTVLQYLHSQTLWKEVMAVANRFISPQAWEFATHESGARHRADLVFGTVLTTDAANFTKVIETFGPDPRRCVPFLSEYFSAISGPVQSADPPGMIVDTAGDGMLTVWDARVDEPRVRLAACLAACRIRREVDEFNLAHPSTPMPTRIGLHSGNLALAAIDARERRFVKAIGDVTNTAARIETLNKRIGTTLLASHAAVAGFENILLLRPCGSYLLLGKQAPVAIVEIVDEMTAASARQKSLVAEFATALALFEGHLWPEAGAAFDAFLARFPDDGPGVFLRSMCDRQAANPPDGHEPHVIVITDK